MAEQQERTEQDLLPDEGEKDAGGEGERDQGVEDITKVGIGDDDIRSGDEGPDAPELPDEGFDGDD
jgi:hypothetical protein